MDVEDKIKFIEDCLIDIRKDIRRIDRENEGIGTYLFKKVKPLVESIEMVKEIKQEDIDVCEVSYFG